MGFGAVFEESFARAGCPSFWNESFLGAGSDFARGVEVKTGFGRGQFAGRVSKKAFWVEK
jgi:hypothetical protein